MKQKAVATVTASKLLVKPRELRAVCDPAILPFETTAEATNGSAADVVQQDRALDAIEFGLGIDTRGFNLFVVGETGSGKTSILKKILNKRASEQETPQDLCYVHDFDDPMTPRALMLPAGQGHRFAKAMAEAVQDLRREIHRALAGQAVADLRSKISMDGRKKEERLFKRLAREAKAQGLSLRKEEDRLLIMPLVDGEPIDADDYGELSDQLRARIEEAAAALHERFAAYDRERIRISRKTQDKMAMAERRALKPIVGELIWQVREEFEHLDDGDVGRYLDQVVASIVEDYRVFLPPEEWGRQDNEEQAMMEGESDEEPLQAYMVNVLVDRRKQKGAPVVFEPNPSHSNLMGYLEYRELRGALRTDHTLVRPGALHRANGGYLILQIQDLAQHPAAWEALKKAIRLKEVRTEELAEEGRPKTSGAIHPAPIPLSTKVVLIGSPESYYLLKTQDDEFSRLFKVKAEFAYSAPRTKSNIMRLARFMARVGREEGYLPMHRGAVALVVEQASRYVEDQKEMTTRLSYLLDLMAEGNYWARRARRKVISAADIRRGLDERELRHSHEEDQVLRMIKRGTLLLDVKGDVVGQINGLAVYDLGDFAFGVPQRITAQVFVGKKGVVSIEREVKLSGAIHDKGALTMTGYLGGRFAQSTPLAFTASVTFEQLYSGVEGDSASATELFAMLSSLSYLPIRQGLAVTGSVNQLGEIQPVGGINEKIEGMYKLCKLKGLSGEQGVIIPRRNVPNLMLDNGAREAIAKGTFRLWAVDTVDQAMEILTGVPAGRRRKDGSFPEGTINALVQRRLVALADLVQGTTAL